MDMGKLLEGRYDTYYLYYGLWQSQQLIIIYHALAQCDHLPRYIFFITQVTAKSHIHHLSSLRVYQQSIFGNEDCKGTRQRFDETAALNICLYPQQRAVRWLLKLVKQVSFQLVQAIKCSCEQYGQMLRWWKSGRVWDQSNQISWLNS